MFKKHKLYIKVKRNHVTVVNLLTGEEVSRSAMSPFSTERAVLAKFNPANDTISAAIRELRLKTSIFALNIVIHQQENSEGGLTDIEKRALRDIAEAAGAGKVYIAEGENQLSNEQALEMIGR